MSARLAPSFVLMPGSSVLTWQQIRKAWLWRCVSLFCQPSRSLFLPLPLPGCGILGAGLHLPRKSRALELVVRVNQTRAYVGLVRSVLGGTREEDVAYEREHRPCMCAAW